MNAFILILIPLILVAGYLLVKDRQAFKRLRPFRAVRPKEAIQVNYAVHQISRMLLLFSPLFLRVEIYSLWQIGSLVLYILGLLLLYSSLSAYVDTPPGDFVKRGIYRWSRQPLYLSQCLIFLAAGLLADLTPYLFILLAFIISKHALILDEEAAYMEHFGQDYVDYMTHVRRYF